MILFVGYEYNTTDANRITSEAPGLVHKVSDKDSEVWVLALDDVASTDISAPAPRLRLTIPPTGIFVSYFQT